MTRLGEKVVVAEDSDEVLGLLMGFLRRNDAAVRRAADLAARVPGPAGPGPDVRQRAVVLLDAADRRTETFFEVAVESGLLPRAALEDGATDGVVLVMAIPGVRSLVGMVSTVPIERFDEAASYAATTRGMMLVVLSHGGTFLGCLSRAGAPRGEA